MEVLAVWFTVNSVLDVVCREQRQHDLLLNIFLFEQTLTPHGSSQKEKKKLFLEQNQENKISQDRGLYNTTTHR